MHYRDAEDLYDKFGGKFAFTVLLQKRVRQLVGGEKRLLKLGEGVNNPIDIALAEARAGKIRLVNDEVVATEEAEVGA